MVTRGAGGGVASTPASFPPRGRRPGFRAAAGLFLAGLGEKILAYSGRAAQTYPWVTCSPPPRPHAVP
jgi:hypothetical protein